MLLTALCTDHAALLPSERVGNGIESINHPLPVHLTSPILLDATLSQASQPPRRSALVADPARNLQLMKDRKAR